jgi:hypothetical protein
MHVDTHPGKVSHVTSPIQYMALTRTDRFPYEVYGPALSLSLAGLADPKSTFGSSSVSQDTSSFPASSISVLHLGALLAGRPEPILVTGRPV